MDSVLRSRPQYFFVLCCLVLLLVLPAVIPATNIESPLSLLGFAVPVLAVAAASDTRLHRRTALVLAILCALANAESMAQVTNLPRQVGPAVALLFLAYTTYLLLNSVLRSRRVTADVIAGALASYLMIGLTWAIAYGLVETIERGSIDVPGEARADLPTLVYFSYITLMSIGYGDVTPVTAPARMLAVLEGLTGMSFTTIVLAGLVAILLTEHTKE